MRCDVIQCDAMQLDAMCTAHASFIGCLFMATYCPFCVAYLLPAYLPTRLPACPPTCLHTSLLARLRNCLHACMPARLPTCPLGHKPSFLPASPPIRSFSCSSPIGPPSVHASPFYPPLTLPLQASSSPLSSFCHEWCSSSSMLSSHWSLSFSPHRFDSSPRCLLQCPLTHPLPFTPYSTISCSTWSSR